MADNPIVRAAHALLDMVVAFDENASEAENARAVETAFANLNEVDAISATFDDKTDVVTLEATPLLTAIGVIVDTLVRKQASEHGQDRLTALNELRGQVDDVLGAE